MSIETIVLMVGLASVSGVAAFFFATSRSKKELIVLSEELATLKNDKGRLENENYQLDNALGGAEQKLKETEVSLASVETENNSISNRKQELEAEIKESQVRLDEQSKLALSAEKSNQGTLSELKQVKVQLEESKLLRKELADSLEAKQSELTLLTKQYAELKISMDEREMGHAREVDNFEKQKQALSEQFENLSNKIFEEKGKAFADSNKNNIDGLLKPFRDQIEGFQKRVNEVHSETIKGNATLDSEIKKVLDIGLKMSDEASNLTSALKGDSQQRGAWGEAQLKRTLEMSGLIEDAHYEAQSSFKDLEGKDKQTDYLVKLPDDKHIIIDSKVSLNDYDRAASADTPEAYNFAMEDHIKAVKKHIDDLAKKDYTNLVGMRSPSFVLMFMPIEPAYIDALKSNKDLFSYGYNKGIVLVSHTTLIPILRTVANLWMMERSNQEAREISDKAGDIYNQVCAVAENLHKLGNTLGTVGNHYNKTVTSLVGSRGLHGKVERFKTLSNKVSKSMPAIEPTHVDFENERLALVVEPIEEGQDEKDIKSIGEEIQSESKLNDQFSTEDEGSDQSESIEVEETP